MCTYEHSRHSRSQPGPPRRWPWMRSRQPHTVHSLGLASLRGISKHKDHVCRWWGAENVGEHVWKLSEGEYLRRTEKVRNDNRKDSHRRTVPKAATSGSVYRFLFSAVERITNVITIYNLVSLALGGHVACRHSAGAKLSTPSAYPQIRLRHMVCSRQYCYKQDNIDS